MKKGSGVRLPAGITWLAERKKAFEISTQNICTSLVYTKNHVGKRHVKSEYT